ncbi:MAG: LTA synthase family protein [Prevotellaceae bacterium]|nr:LTA synthase family protein [Prevotellaceae bacterium]
MTNSIALAANCIDIIYFRFTLRRTTFAVFREFENENNMIKLFAGFFIQYWYIVLIFILLIVIMVLFYGKVQKPEFRKSAWFYYVLNTLYLCIGAGLFVAAARGDFSPFNRPITLSNAAEYTKEPIEMPLVQSTPTAIIRTLSHLSLKEYRFFNGEELDRIYTPVKDYQPEGEFKYKNVVIFILESFSAEYMKAYNKHIPDYKSLYTPFLDSLMQHSRYFLYSYANGRKSIDAMPSVLASIPSIEGPYVLSPYSGNMINGIAGLLRKIGYRTAFFHGAPNGSMGFSAVANLAGFEKYYGMTEFNNPEFFDRTNGIYDEEFFQYYAEEMNKMTEPFCTALFSLSSHTPFTLPDRYKDVFTGTPTPFLNSLRYSDYSLKRFFETASKMPWFKNTLFVLSADHGGTYSLFDEYKTSVGVYAAPIIFYAPGDSTLIWGENCLAQQIDIMPSVLSYLNYNGSFVAFGNNLFEKCDDYFVVNFPNMLQLLWDDYMIYFDGEKIISLFKFKEDKMLSNNLLNTSPEIERIMELKAKAFLQQYTTRLIENRLTIEK